MRTSQEGFKSKEGRIRLDIRKKFSTMRALRQLKRLLREAVDAQYMGVFSVRLDEALSNPVRWKISLLTAGGWSWMILKVTSNPSHWMILLYNL